ncbi:DpnII family type II restriction endonuclease [Caldicellulosiruptoraceae bacterium PP1]
MKEFYLEKLQKTNFENVIEEFHKTLIDTNRSLDFFVDWKKVKKNVEK